MLPLSSFGRDKTRANGTRSKCRDCDNARRKARWKSSYWTPERLALKAAREAWINSHVAATLSVLA